jgi:hypothetical protein
MENETEKFTRKEAAEYLRKKYRGRCSVATLAKMASRGGGPPFRYVGRFPLYEGPDLDAWAAERLTGKVLSTAGRPDLRDSARRLGRQRPAMRV